jgi:membrane fusion protein, multidrug efflux system
MTSPRHPLLAAGLALGACLFLAACSKAPAPAAAAADLLRVEVVPSVVTAEPIPVEASGTLGRREESVLSFKTGGVIASVRFRAGDAVARGQEIASLQLDEIDAQVAQARAGLEKAKRDLDRARALQAERVATLENLQDAQSAFDVAEAGLKAALFNRERSVIVAPANGRILRRLAEPEELAGPGRPIVTFAGDDQGWIVRAGLAETDVLRLHTGDPALVRVGDSASVTGTLSQIAESADPATRTVEVEVALDAPPPVGWRSGFVAQVVVTPRPVAPRAAVPLSALVEGRASHASIFVLSADRSQVHRVDVEVEGIHRQRAYLRTPLAAATPVVTTGAEFLSEGRTVTATEAPAPTP